MAGSWQVDVRHSDAKLITDATTDYGKTKINATLGFARIDGTVTINDGDPTKSGIEFRFYPATSMAPAIAEDGKFLSHWLENLSNHTLVCFHSKRVVRTPDGRLQATGDLTVTRVDRNVQADPTEAYAGPGKPVAVICHGPWTVIETGHAKGKKIASWPSLKTDLQNAGAEWLDQEVVVDGNLVSSRKPDDIPAFNREMLKLF
jgi:hypothetical protein